MSHFTVIVVGNDVEGQLAPYDENTQVEPYEEVEAHTPLEYWATKNWIQEGELRASCTMQELLETLKRKYPGDDERYYINDEGFLCRTSTYNPKSKWDWYQIGGRWTGYFKLKAGVDAVVGEGGVFANKPDEGHGDVVMVGDVDWQAMEQETMASYRERWHAVRSSITEEERTSFKSWDELEAAHKLAGTPTDVREEYHAQPIKTKIAALLGEAGTWWSPDQFKELLISSLDEYVEAGRLRATCPFAYVVDGQWHERGNMGWWACVSNEQPPLQHERAWEALLKALPPETTLTLVDCHI